jgi:hypothetical protein
VSYIAVDLKVIEGLAGQVARASAASEDRVLAGLVRLWHRCWVTTSDTVTRSQLAGVFGVDGVEALADALVHLEFLDVVEGGWRVRGAERYLRLKESRRAGAQKTNAARSRASLKSRSRASLSDAGATLPDALPPSTEHRTPNTEEKMAPAASQPPLALVEQEPERRPLKGSAAICEDFAAVVGVAYQWQGAKDSAALAAMLKASTLEEVRARWRRGLAEPPGWLQVRTVAQLRAKWNDLAIAQPSGLAQASCVRCGGVAATCVVGDEFAVCYPCAGDWSQASRGGRHVSGELFDWSTPEGVAAISAFTRHWASSRGAA